MSKKGGKFFISAILAGLLLGSSGCQCLKTQEEESETFAITQQPESKLAKRGQEVVFKTDVALSDLERPRYQWFLNCNPIDPEMAKELGISGANEKKLTIQDAGEKHVGFYECVVEHEKAGEDGPAVITEKAELMVYHQSVLTVYGTPIGGSGNAGSGNCPPRYAGYVNFRKPTPPYGWKLSRDAVEGRASDTNRNGTVVRYFGSTLTKNRCGTQSVVIPKDTDTYRFTIYFPTGTTVPSGPYSILLEGFDP